MERKIVEILYRYGEELTTQGIIKDSDIWLWEGEFSKVAEDVVGLLPFFGVNAWIPLTEKYPTVEDHGEKVLLYRLNGFQKRMAVSIHDTTMVRYCDVNETWWMAIPHPPC